VPLSAGLPVSTVTPQVVYLHGFASSPASSKAAFVGRRLAAHGVPFHCPDLNQPDFSTLTASRMIERTASLIATLPAGPVVEDSITLVKWAEANGFDDVWFSDAMAPDSLTMVAAVASYAKRMRVGVAVTPVYTRTPAVFAATANVLAQLLPDRFVLGLGSSSQAIMERFNGIKMDKPLTRVKETAVMIRSMLAGERSDFDLTTLKSKGYRQEPLAKPPPIYLAALRPKMIEMAAEVGDGVVFNLWPQKALPKMMEHVEIGAKRAGKRIEDLEIVNRLLVMVTDDVEYAKARFRSQYAPYYANPVYNNFLKWAGFPDEAEGILAGWEARDRELSTSSITDEMIDTVCNIGDAETVQRRIREDAEAGIDTTIVSPVGQMPLAEAMPTFEAFTADRFAFTD